MCLIGLKESCPNLGTITTWTEILYEMDPYELSCKKMTILVVFPSEADQDGLCDFNACKTRLTYT